MCTGIEPGPQLPKVESGNVGGLMSLTHQRELELSLEEEESAIFSFLFLSSSTERLTCDETHMFHSQLFKGCVTSESLTWLRSLHSSLLCWIFS